MNGFEIGMIGGTGGIGRWFANLFAGEGYPVHVSGRAEGMPLPALAARCRVVVVAVPIAETARVIRQVGPLLPEDSLLMDLTSLKEEPVREMLKATGAAVIGCHPLFGPEIFSLDGQNVVLCPVRERGWMIWLEEFFTQRGARVTVATPEEHDRMMALVQGLTHLESVLMGLILRDSGTKRTALEAFSTPVFRTKQAIIEKVFEAPALYAGLLAGNPHLPVVIERYERNLALVQRLVRKGNAAELETLLRTP